MVKKIALNALGAILLYAGNDACVQAFQKDIAKVIPDRFGVFVNEVKKIPIDGNMSAEIVDVNIYKQRVNGKDVIQKTNDVIYCSKKFYATNLHFFDKQKESKVRTALLNILKQKGILIQNGDNGEYVILSNPLCPFCKMYVPKILQKLQEQNATVYLVDLPIGHLGGSEKFIAYQESALKKIPQSKEKIAYLKEMYAIKIDDKNLSKAENEMKRLYKKYTKEEYQKTSKKIVGNNIDIKFLMRYFNVKGTPSVLDKEGNLVSIKDLLEQK